MEKKYIFNSSMPRSGSELLQVLLHQNPEIYGSVTSPLLEYWFGARQNLQTPEVKSQPEDVMEKAFYGFCRNGMDGYYNEITDRPIVCDKSRGWLYYYNWVESVLGEKPKMICCIRDLREVLVSMEKIFRKNKHLPDSIDNPSQMANLIVEQRVDYWLNTQPVGLALQRLYDADVQGYLENIHIIKYEDLVESPIYTMQKMYEYLELPYYEHNFDNIIKKVPEDSSIYGVYGDHNVQIKLESKPNDYNEILGVQLSENILDNNAWYYDKFYS